MSGLLYGLTVNEVGGIVAAVILAAASLCTLAGVVIGAGHDDRKP